MAIEIPPDAAIVPVVTASRNHGFIRSKGLQVVDTSAGTLKSLSVSRSANVVI